MAKSTTARQKDFVQCRLSKDHKVSIKIWINPDLKKILQEKLKKDPHFRSIFYRKTSNLIIQ